MDHTKLPASNSELGFAGLVDFGADIVGDLLVGDVDSAVGGDGSVLLLGNSNEACDSAAIAMLRADDDDTVRGKGACDVRVRVSASSQTVGKDHGRPSLVLGRRFEKLRILMGWDRSVVKMSGQESVDCQRKSWQRFKFGTLTKGTLPA